MKSIRSGCGQGQVEDFQEEISIGLGDAHRRGEPDGVAPEAAFAEQETEVFRAFDNC